MSYTRLYEVSNEMDLNLIKLRFNTENIDYRVLFEETLRTGKMEAMGAGGAILEVQTDEVEFAKFVLSELDIELEYDPQEDEFSLLSAFDAQTKDMTVLGQLPLSYRFLLVITLIAFFVFFLMIYLAS